MRTSRLCVAALTVLALVAAGSAVADQHEKPTKHVLIQMGHFTDDLHAAFMAVKLGKALQQEGAHVTLFLNLEAVYMVDSRRPLDMRWGQNEMTLETVLTQFLRGDGKILVCPHCARAAGLEKDSLRSGAKIAKEAEVAKAIMAADVVLDY
jgi:predicted peroxiredoxin